MNTTLERRMSKLEASRLGANQIAINSRCIVGRETVRAIIGDKVTDRRTDEAKDAFMERSKVEALASTNRRTCRVILQPAAASL